MRKVDTKTKAGRDVRGSLTVKDVMSSPVITAGVKTGIKDVAKLMTKHGIGSVVITNKQREPIGLITQGDIIRRFVSRKRRPLFAKARHIMSSPVFAIGRDVTLEEAAKYMVEKKIRKLCVIDRDNKLSGIVTSTDIMKNENYLIDVLKEIINTGYVREGGQTAGVDRIEFYSWL